jgi:hypothetical protein
MGPVEMRRRNSLIITVVIAALCVVAVLAWSAIDAKPQVLARLESNSGQFLIIGKADGKLDVLLRSWSITMWWKRSSPYWVCYFLDHESTLWSDVRIREEKNHILVTKGGEKLAASLNLADFSLVNSVRNTVEHPIGLSKTDPARTESRIELSPDSRNWLPAWKEFSENSTSPAVE